MVIENDECALENFFYVYLKIWNFNAFTTFQQQTKKLFLRFKGFHVFCVLSKFVFLYMISRGLIEYGVLFCLFYNVCKNFGNNSINRVWKETLREKPIWEESRTRRWNCGEHTLWKNTWKERAQMGLYVVHISWMALMVGFLRQ